MVTKEKKQELVETYRLSDQDTGSSYVQIAILTSRIEELTQHLRTHRKDFASRRGLMMMVGKRRRLLRYVGREDPEGYQKLIGNLGLRK
ncbi:MAG TPA: 30S ribosomal protein S15 [Dehalococcoidia bacterium]|nr:30S ribosomal protein S15 [Dehalococcoidia bacterium]